MRFSVSYTTRPRRHNEVDGVDYSFVTEERFTEMAEAGEFAEWAVVHGNKYGTSRAVVEGALSEGHDVVFDVDWQGGLELSKQWPDDALMIFILPPDLTILADRLRRRATDASDVIERRLKMAIEEIGHHDIYPHKIINDDLEEAYGQLRAVYLCRRQGEDAPEEARTVVKANLAANVGAHAERLMSEGGKS